jgi:hypothetical protein
MGVAIPTAAFQIQINDPADCLGWQPWHGFPGRRLVDGYDDIETARRAVRTLHSHRPRWRLRLIDADGRPVPTHTPGAMT